MLSSARRRRRVSAVVVVSTLLLGLASCRGDSPHLDARSWVLLEESGNELLLRVSGGPCTRFERVDVQETPTEVGIAVLHRGLGGVRDCADMEVHHCQRVHLQEPLGDRRLTYGTVRPQLARATLMPEVAEGARADEPSRRLLDLIREICPAESAH